MWIERCAVKYSGGCELEELKLHTFSLGHKNLMGHGIKLAGRREKVGLKSAHFLPSSLFSPFHSSHSFQFEYKHTHEKMYRTSIAHAVKQHKSPHTNGLKPHSNRATLPPTPSGKSTLVLDLDETLISCDHTLITAPDGFPGPESIRLRPHLANFLAITNQLFDLVIWTAGTTRYAEIVVEKIRRETGFSFACCLSRPHCTPVEDDDMVGGMSFVKDLGRLQISEHQVAILDNNPKAYMLQVKNGIPIKDWFGEPDDEELAIMAQKLRDFVCRYGPNASLQTFAQAVQGDFFNGNAAPPCLNSACDRVLVTPEVEEQVEAMDWEYTEEEYEEEWVQIMEEEEENQRRRVRCLARCLTRLVLLLPILLLMAYALVPASAPTSTVSLAPSLALDSSLVLDPDPAAPSLALDLSLVLDPNPAAPVIVPMQTRASGDLGSGMLGGELGSYFTTVCGVTVRRSRRIAAKRS